MQPGLAARAGILSAYLARDGLTGPVHFLEGKFGLFRLYFADRCNPEAITDQLGSRFEIDHLGSKPYPCCRLSHTAIDALLDLLAAEEFSLEEVEKIEVQGSSAMNTMCGKPYRISASSEIDAQFSLQYLLVTAIQKRWIRIDDFSAEAVRSPGVVGQAEKVQIQVSPEIKNRWGAIVRVKKKDGKVLSRRVDIPKGQPENPMTWDEYVKKFKTCADYAARALQKENLDKWVQQVENLELVANTNGLAHLLIGSSAAA